MNKIIVISKEDFMDKAADVVCELVKKLDQPMLTIISVPIVAELTKALFNETDYQPAADSMEEE